MGRDTAGAAEGAGEVEQVQVMKVVLFGVKALSDRARVPSSSSTP